MATQTQTPKTPTVQWTPGPSNPGAYNRLLSILFKPAQPTNGLHTYGG
ncbi:hypothetical protein [Streptomyces sp. NPDC006631]